MKKLLGFLVGSLMFLTGCQFAWIHTLDDGTSPTWDCGPIHYEMVDSGQSQREIDVVHQVFGELSAIMGRAFIFDGLVDQRSFGVVTIKWENLTDVYDENHVVGITWTAADLGAERYGNADVTLDDNIPEWFYPLVVRHELGHAMGLDHVHSRDEVMHLPPYAEHYGEGDRWGLFLLGQYRCV